LCLDFLNKEPFPIIPGSGAAMQALHFRRSWKHCGDPPAAAALKQNVYPGAPACDLISPRAIRTQAIRTSVIKNRKKKGGGA